MRIYRNSQSEENLLEELTDGVSVGSEMSWTDEQATTGAVNTYVIVPCRIAGEQGLPATVSVYVGFDAPNEVGSIRLERVDEGIKVTWEKPRSTQNGGVLDLSTLTYRIVRMPDDIVVAEATSDTTLIDTNPLPTWQKYSYLITAKTAAGESRTSGEWTTIYAGAPFTAPFETSFDDYDACQLWGNYNENNDGFNGYFDSSNGRYNITAVYYDDNAIKNLNTYLISPTINLKAGKYKVTVESYIDKADFANSFEILYGNEQTVAAQTNKVGSYSFTSTQDSQSDFAVAEFTLQSEGKYNFAIHLTSAKIADDYAKSGLGIGSFKLELIEEATPTATAIRIPQRENEETDKNHYQFRFRSSLAGKSSTITMSAWVKMNNAQGQIMGIAGEQYWWWQYDAAWINVVDGKLKFNNLCKINSFSRDVDTEVATEQEVEVGKWAFITLVFDKASNTRSLYYNGELVTSAEIGGIDGLAWPTMHSTVFFVGKGITEGEAEMPTYDASVDVDEVQVWTRALTADEIKASMIEVDTQASGLCYLYRFTEKNEDNTYNNLAPAGEAKAALYKGETKWNSYALTYSPTIVEAESVPGHGKIEKPETTYAVTWATKENGKIEVRLGDQVLESGARVPENSEITVTVTPDHGYGLMYLMAGGDELTNGGTYTVTKDTEIEYAFMSVSYYTVEWGTPSNGTIEVKAGDRALTNGEEVEEETEIVITATPAEGYELEYLLVMPAEDLLASGDYYYVTEDIFIEATFIPAGGSEEYTVTISTPENGKIEVMDGGVALESGATVPNGTELTITATPDEGYVLETLTVNGAEFESGEIFSVTEDVAIAATFKKMAKECTFSFNVEGVQWLDYVIITDEGGKEYGFEDKVAEGTKLTATGKVMNAKSKVFMKVNGEETTVTMDDVNFSAQFTIENDTQVEITVTDPNGIEDMNAGVAAYYADGSLHVAAPSSVAVYDLAGRMVVRAEVESVLPLDGLASGAYVAVVNGQVLKFNK